MTGGQMIVAGLALWAAALVLFLVWEDRDNPDRPKHMGGGR